MLLIGEWALPVEGGIGSRLAAAVEGGFDGVELVWCDEGSMLAGSPAPAVAVEARRVGVTIASLCTEPLSIAPDGGGTFADGIEDMVKTATLLGVEVVVVNLGRLDGDHARRVVELASRAADRVGVSIAVENGLEGDLLTHTCRAAPHHRPPVTPRSTFTSTSGTPPPRLPSVPGSLRINASCGRSTSRTGAQRMNHRACGDGDVDWRELWEHLRGRLPSIVTVEHSHPRNCGADGGPL